MKSILAVFTLLLALFVCGVRASQFNRRLLFTSGQCDLEHLSDLSGRWWLRRDGGGMYSPIVAEKCCSQPVSFLWQDCNSAGLAPQSGALCAIIVVGGSMLAPQSNQVDAHNVLETREPGTTPFYWYIEQDDINAAHEKFRIFRHDGRGARIYVAANLCCGSKSRAALSASNTVFEWSGATKSRVGNPCRW